MLISSYMIYNISRETGIPLIGTIYFGIIDRGTNLLQIRASNICNLNCSFCSVDSGPDSKTRANNYFVELEYLVDTIKDVIKYKEIQDIECHLDSTGEPIAYPKIVELARKLKEIPEVKITSLQTNGTLISKTKIKQLEKAKLDRINLSINSMDGELAKKLSGVKWYDLEKIKYFAEEIAKSDIDLLIAPLYLPKINDGEIPKIINFAKEVGAGKKFPPLGIQKYEKYKLGRKPIGLKMQTWWKFYNHYLKKLEKKHSVKLILKPEDFGIYKINPLPKTMKKNEKVRVEIVGPGWTNNEMLGVARGRAVSILNCKKESGTIKTKIVSNKHNIYVGVPIN